jgi:hypothetical protein
MGARRRTGEDVSISVEAETEEEAVVRANRRGVLVASIVLEPPPPPEITHLFTKVVGVTHRNHDKTSRQRIIRECLVGEAVMLNHEDDNRFDVNAVGVLRLTGEQIGYLGARLAADVVRRAANGHTFTAYICSLTGGEEGTPTRGVNLLIMEGEPGVTNERAQAYPDDVIRSGAFT